MSGVSGIVLAGGQGRRMGGVDKGLQPLRGKPMVQWVLERLAPQVDEVLINANQNLDTYAAFGHRVVPDDIADVRDACDLLAPVAERLGDSVRFVALDFPGFGASAKPTDHRYRIHAAADAVYQDGLPRSHRALGPHHAPCGQVAGDEGGGLGINDSIGQVSAAGTRYFGIELDGIEHLDLRLADAGLAVELDELAGAHVLHALEAEPLQRVADRLALGIEHSFLQRHVDTDLHRAAAPMGGRRRYEGRAGAAASPGSPAEQP